MSEHNEPAFPTRREITTGGLTVRDVFAGLAMRSILDVELRKNIPPAPEGGDELTAAQRHARAMARMAYMQADAMLEVRQL